VPVAGGSLLLFPQAGGFYSAEDADSYPTTASGEKREGAFCVWAAEEIRTLLPDPVEGATEGTTLGDVFMHHYGVKEAGNVSPVKVREGKDLPGPGSTGGVPAPLGTGRWQSSPEARRVQSFFQDPHQELKGKNVLTVRCSPELTAARLGLEPGRLGALLREGRRRLAAARAQRPRPHLDTKMLAAWNGERAQRRGLRASAGPRRRCPGPAGFRGARSDESCWEWAAPQGGSGGAEVRGGGSCPTPASRGAAEGWDTALV